jgi:hypothetical protein
MPSSYLPKATKRRFGCLSVGCPQHANRMGLGIGYKPPKKTNRIISDCRHPLYDDFQRSVPLRVFGPCQHRGQDIPGTTPLFCVVGAIRATRLISVALKAETSTDHTSGPVQTWRARVDLRQPPISRRAIRSSFFAFSQNSDVKGMRSDMPSSSRGRNI